MIKPFVSTGRRFWLRAALAVSPFLLIAGMASSTIAPVSAQERIDACEAYEVYVAAGSGDSGLAEGMQRVCEQVGPVALSQPCMTYYTRVTDTDFPPSNELKQHLAAACEDSMPGATYLSLKDGDASGGACRDRECREPEPVLMPEPLVDAPGWDAGLECGAGLECRPEPPDPDPVAPDEIDSVTADDGPVLTDGGAYGPPADTLECGAGLECRPEPDDPPPGEDPESEPVAASDPPPADKTESVAPDTSGALELAFWEAIVDSDDPTLFAAYLEEFPDGTFVPIARARIAALSAPGPVPPVAAAPDPVVAEPTPDPAPALSPEELYANAQVILDSAYQRPVAEWNAAIAPAIPMLEQSGAGGWAPAFVELGGLAENGLGMPADTDLALGYFIEAGQMGALEGYYRALMLYDQTGNDDQYVGIFLTLYGINPAMALDSLDSVGRNGPTALQRMLKAEGQYRGALDGAFGAASREALARFVNGEPPPVSATASSSSLPADGLAVELQMALQRVGCYLGTVDGRWGPASIDAMAAFNLWNGSHYPTIEPSVQALNGVSRTPGQICGVD